jgi:ATP-dependent DNA ligase
MAKRLHVQNAVIDGEAACLDEHGRTIFSELLFSRGDCVFLAFDLLFLSGHDLRGLPLLQRKRRLQRWLADAELECCMWTTSRKLDARCSSRRVAGTLKASSQNARTPPYRVTLKLSPLWIKIKNPAYSEKEGREELFER